MTEPELWAAMGEKNIWAARDWKGELYQFNDEPENIGTEEHPLFWTTDGDDEVSALALPPTLLPSLAPGEKCRVAIVRLTDQVIYAAETLLSLEAGAGVTQESVCMGQALARHVLQAGS